MKATIILLIIASVWCNYVETIGNGDYISITEAPYYVSLSNVLIKSSTHEHLCGGSILSENWILTAAHCANNLKFKPMRARTGATDKFGEGIVYEVQKIIIHPDYEEGAINGRTSHTDIALLKLSKPISFSKYQQPIKIRNKPLEMNDTVTIVGLGREKENRFSASLKKTTMTVTQIESIEHLMPTLVILGAEGTQACAGDSGSPTVMNNELVGLLSLTFGCMIWENPDLDYNAITPVYPYLDWINQITGISYS